MKEFDRRIYTPEGISLYLCCLFTLVIWLNFLHDAMSLIRGYF